MKKIYVTSGIQELSRDLNNMWSSHAEWDRFHEIKQKQSVSRKKKIVFKRFKINQKVKKKSTISKNKSLKIMKLMKKTHLVSLNSALSYIWNARATLFSPPLLCPWDGGNHVSLKISIKNQVLARKMDPFSPLRWNKLKPESSWQNSHQGNIFSHCCSFYFFTLEKWLGKWKKKDRFGATERDDCAPKSEAYPHRLFGVYCYFASLILYCAVDCRPQWDSV